MNLDRKVGTSNVGVSVLRNVFEDWDDSIDDIISLKVGKDVFKFTISDTSDLWFDIIEILGVIRQKHFELFFAHGRC